MIRINELLFSYGYSEFELSIPELSIDQGETVAIVGPSGSGKSTLLMLLSGIFALTSGSIRMGELQLESLSEAARRRFRSTQIGLVFQELELIEYLSVRENILLPCFISRSSPMMTMAQVNVESLAATIGIADKLSQHPQQLSQGERQRVAICRALITNPEYLLVDEPTGSLDPQRAHEVLELLLDPTLKHNRTLLMVTHDQSLLGRFSRVVNLPDLKSNYATGETT